jgi:hypothetical protein
VSAYTPATEATIVSSAVALEDTSAEAISSEAIEDMSSDAIEDLSSETIEDEAFEDLYSDMVEDPSPEIIEDLSSEGIETATTAVESMSFTTVKVSTMNPVDEAMERAKVANADHARFLHIDPTALKFVLEQKSELELTLETVELGEMSLEVQWCLGTLPDAVEVTLMVVKSHEAALAGMRQTLHCVSAPLDEVFAQTMPLGQYSLQGIGGDGYILFVRGNVFVKLTGLTSCEELGTIAIEVDKFLKAKEVGFESLSNLRVEFLDTPGRVVKAGEIFEVAVKVADIGWTTAFTNVEVAQLLEVDMANTTFKFYGVAAGMVDIQLVFAQKDTLQTTTATVHVEVIDDDSSENLQRLEEFHV